LLTIAQDAMELRPSPAAQQEPDFWRIPGSTVEV